MILPFVIGMHGELRPPRLLFPFLMSRATFKARQRIMQEEDERFFAMMDALGRETNDD